MAVKSIIDIDVNDDAFKSFMDLFGKYQNAVKKLPGAWNQTGKSIENAADGMADMTAAILTQTELLNRQTRAQEKMRHEVDKTNVAMTKLGKATRGIFSDMVGISGHFLRWGGIGAAFGSVFSAAGAFGFGQLAHQANQNRMQSTALGLTPGQLRAAEITYQNVNGAAGALSYAANLKTDLGMRGDVANFITSAEIDNMSATDVHEQLLSRIRSRYIQEMRDNPATAAMRMRAYGAEHVIGVEGMRQMAAIPEEEWRGYGPAMRQRAAQIGGSNDTNARYSEFLKRLETMGTTLQTKLIDRLVVLEPSLEKVVDAFGNLAKAALDSPQFKAGIESFAKFINDVADGKYKDAFEEMLKAVKALASGVWSIITWFNADSLPRSSGDDFRLRRSPDAPRRGTTGLNQNLLNQWYGPTQRMSYSGGQFGALEQGYNLPPGMLDAVYQIESGGGRNTGRSRKGAEGPFQFMPTTAAAYGVSDPMDLGQSSRGAAAMLSDLMRQFGGDPMKAAAAYNWGSGNLSKAIAQYGGDWLSHAPAETQAYVNRLSGMIGGTQTSLMAQPGQAVQILVYDATGGNLVNIATGLGAPGYAI